ncbi:MAG: hypothetical protein ACRD34_02785 [Bryobacteraceae bacterium]
MLFRRERPKILTFSERVDLLREAGFASETLPDGRVKITKNGIGAVIGDEGKNQLEIERAGVLLRSEIAVLLNRGFQMFLEAPSGHRIAATADHLKALHQFEDDVKDALGLINLYNTSLGTTSRRHMYDRVFKRDIGAQPMPWLAKQNRFVPPNTKSTYSKP